MSQTPAPTPEEAEAAKRYTVMNLVRLASIVAVGLGIAIARDIIALPYALGVALALGGLVAFFFLPVTLAKRWKAGDARRSGDRGEQ